MRRFPMNRMPVVIRSTGQQAVVLDMNLPDEAFTADGKPHDKVIPEDVRCWIEVNDMGSVSRRELAFGDLDLA